MAKPVIKTREPKKKKQDTFAHIQQPHPLADLLDFRSPSSTPLGEINDNIKELTLPRETADEMASETANSTADNIANNTATSLTTSPADNTTISIPDSPSDSLTDSDANNNAANPPISLTDSRAGSPTISRAESLATSHAHSLVHSTVESTAESEADNTTDSRAESPLVSPAASTALARAQKTSAAIARRNQSVGRVVKKSPKVHGQPLDATHTASEKSVYSVMYRLTITAGENPRRFTNPELQGLTGINSNTTIGRALKGLCSKLSIVITNRQGQNRHGIELYVRPPSEILQLREAAGLIIEPVRKEIMAITNPQAYEQLFRLNVSDETADDMANDMADEMANSRAGSPTASMGLMQPLDLSKMQVQKKESLLINKYSDDVSKKTDTSSPIRGEIDAEKLAQVRDLFHELSNGGKWKPERDEAAFLEIQHVPLWHIIVGLANSLIRCTEHRYSCLRYSVPAILEHYDKMKLFPERDMLGVAYNLMQRALNCRAAGKWTIPEWEAGPTMPPDPEQDWN